MKVKNFFLISVWFCFENIFSWSQILFTPRDAIKKQLIAYIDQEQKSIHAAMYMFTEKSIAQALVHAFLRGVKVEVILDQISMGERIGKGTMLQKSGISVTVFKTDVYNPFSMPIMHHKFFIFGHNGCLKRSLLWTGSFNCTASASKQNYENVLVSDDMQIIKEYGACFDMLVSDLEKK